ncbi:GTPase HflX [Anaerotalea alkaliphila]|uniref:GTPase HflX n=1 Tax=Anaerotalea alkaliphila TaxID=2662126 RepID=A0A7X5KPN4_9FIRM|nr:GTPase HflX [Anaerotalea alkaliphila]NDL68432.1 GTPase HflX [Anaerotalea alkaliphila]
MNETMKSKERVILLAVGLQNKDMETLQSLDELAELTDTAGAVAVHRMIQNRDGFHPATYVGKGKIEEIKEALAIHEATTVICDDELSPTQLRNLEQQVDAKVIDRTALILDIFAQHAHTSEGILQVELAQLKYRSSRLIGLRASLSRLGGGIGTRGPGEKKLEMDRRLLRTRMEQLKSELEEVHRHRSLLREGRKRQGKPLVAIVGYTNAGKSTLLNALTDAGVREEDQLFATLDPTTRNLVLPEGKEILLTDTVGFIRKLPHHLVDAFRSTLEEAVFADLLIHVVDAGNPQLKRHMEVVYSTLRELGAVDKPVLTLFNKCDRPDAARGLFDADAFKSLYVSAKTGEGLPQALRAMEERLRLDKILVKTVIGYQDGSLLNNIRTFGQILVEEYRNEGVYVEAYLDDHLVSKYGLEQGESEREDGE